MVGVSHQSATASCRMGDRQKWFIEVLFLSHLVSLFGHLLCISLDWDSHVIKKGAGAERVTKGTGECLLLDRGVISTPAVHCLVL